MILAIGHKISLSSDHENHRSFLHISQIQIIWQITPHSRLNVLCIFIAFSDFQSKWLAGLWCELCL